GGVPTAATVLGKDETSHAGRLQFLPDGRHFFYSGGTVGATTRPIYVGALDSTERRLMSTEWPNALYADGYVLFPREAMLMAQPFDPRRLVTTGDPIAIADRLMLAGLPGVGVFDASQQGVLAYATDARANSRLLWMDRSGARLGTVGDAGDYAAVSLSPDGTRAAVHVRSQNGLDVSLLDVARGTRLRVTSGTIAGFPTWSHDSKALFFITNSGRDIVRQVPVDPTTREVLLTDDRGKRQLSSSPDDQFLALSVGAPPRLQELWILPLGGERKPYRFQGPEGPYKYGLPIVSAFSPDGRWIAYDSSETGGNEVFVSAFPGPGDKVRVSAAGGSVPRWRHDGRQLFYSTPDGKMMAAAVNGTGWTLGVGSVRELFQIPAIEGSLTYDVSADGQRFLVSTREETGAAPPITVILNWSEELKQRVPTR